MLVDNFDDSAEHIIFIGDLAGAADVIICIAVVLEENFFAKTIIAVIYISAVGIVNIS